MKTEKKELSIHWLVQNQFNMPMETILNILSHWSVEKIQGYFIQLVGFHGNHTIVPPVLNTYLTLARQRRQTELVKKLNQLKLKYLLETPNEI